MPLVAFWTVCVGLTLPAAGDALAQDDERVEELGDRIRKERDDVDPTTFDELGRIGGAAAFEVLADASERLREEESFVALYAAFPYFAGERGLARKAVALLEEPALREEGPVALAAVDALVGLGDPSLETLEAVVAAKRADPAAKAQAADALVPVLGQRGDAESLRTLLMHATLRHVVSPDYVGAKPPPRPLEERRSGFPRTHRGTVRDVLAGLDTPAQLAVLAEALGSEDTRKDWKLLLIETLAPHEDAVVTTGLARALDTDDPNVQMDALHALEGRGEWSELEPHLRGLLRARERGVRRAAVSAMGRHGLLDPAWRAEMLELADSRDPAIRMGATTALVEIRTADAIAKLHELAADDNWSVRLEAWQRIGELRQKESVPVLIERFVAERGRFREDLHAILRVMTGIDLGRDPQRWQTWWEREGEAFEVPSYAQAQAAEAARCGDPEREGGTSSKSFFGVLVPSERVVFVLDISGSMRLPAKGDERSRSDFDVTRRTRLDIAKEQLSLVLRRLEDEVLFNVIFFETNVIPFSKKLQKMRKRTRQQVLRFVHEQVSAGSTALYPALKLAFEDELVDTIYLLSDGAPTEGEITDIAVIRQAVQRWNAHRKVKIHGITVGQDSTLLHWLTLDTGGRYIRID